MTAARPAKIRLLLRATLFATLVPLLVRLPWPLLDRSLRPRATRRSGSVEQIVAAVDRARRLGWPLVRPGCLVRATTLCYLLRRAGIAVDLCFGVSQGDAGFRAHCWLVRGGAPYLEPDSDPKWDFTTVHRLQA